MIFQNKILEKFHLKRIEKTKQYNSKQQQLKTKQTLFKKKNTVKTKEKNEF